MAASHKKLLCAACFLLGLALYVNPYSLLFMTARGSYEHKYYNKNLKGDELTGYNGREFNVGEFDVGALAGKPFNERKHVRKVMGDGVALTRKAEDADALKGLSGAETALKGLSGAEVANSLGDNVADDSNEDAFFDKKLDGPFFNRSFQVEKRHSFINEKKTREELDKAMHDLSPETQGKITSSIEGREVDHKKYRDIFIIKKQVVYDGDRKIVSFDLKERLVPKETDGFLKGPDQQMLFSVFMFFVVGLVLVTTIKVKKLLNKT